MFYVGLDVHSKFIVICILNSNGKIHERHKVRGVEALRAVLVRLPKFAVCFEASCGYGWLHDTLRPLAARVVVGHPGRLRLIFRSRRKNDRLDAEKLAKLLFLDEVPVVHVPEAAVRAWRELINHRQKLVAKRTRAKNAVRALLRSVGVKAPSRPGLWTKRGLAWLQTLEFDQPLHALKRDMLLDEIECFSRQIARAEYGLKRFSQDNPAVDLLRSIPGVGLRTAEAMVAFLDDPQRFRRAKSVGAYLGLVPSQDQSGDMNRLGHITKTGPAVARQLLVEAAWQAIRRSPTVKAFYERIRRGDPGRKKIAIVATAHYLARVMWAMLHNGTLWKESEPATAAASLPWDPEAGSQARGMVPAAPHPGQTRRSRKGASQRT
jgi:transposase